ncbi:MAG: DUF6259 domain-containing protein [Bryobacter sp.]|nr:DUF6259 domain-containing protein [Bryobacter sp.]
MRSRKRATAIRLLLISFLALLPAALSAQSTLRLENDILIAQTPSLEMKFQQGIITSLFNRLTKEEYILRAGTRLLGVTETQPNPNPVSPGNWTLENAGTEQARATLEFSSTTARFVYTVALGNDEEIVLRVLAQSNQPGLISATWGISGLATSPGRLIVPGQTGTFFDERNEIGLLSLDYPVHWENQMVVYESKAGSLLLYSGDANPRFKRLNATTQTGALDVAIETFSTGPYSTATECPPTEWRFAAFAGNWRQPAERYKARMAQTHPFVPALDKKAWIKEIRAVALVFINDLEALDKLAKELIPSQTLVYFVDWREQPFDINYPDYTPSSSAKKFVERARELGFRVMIHTNLLGLSEVHPEYPDFARFQMRQASDQRPIGWLWEEFPAGHPRRVAYISPASSAYRKLFVDSLRPAIEELQPDAIHLDAGGAIINDGSGLVEGMNTMEGIVQLHKDLLAAYPDIVWGGESTNEVIGPYNWLAQRWASDYQPHPLGNFLMGDQVLFYGFLDQPPADEPDFVTYLRRYEAQGVLPGIMVLAPESLGPDRTRTFDLLQQLRRWQEKQYRPDWDADWTNSLFRYRSADGNSTASVETDGKLVRLLEDGQKTYERVRNTNSLTTDQFIPGWPAYNDTQLLGLDPSYEYWLTPEPFRPQSLIHLEQLPENYRLGLGSFTDRRYGYFEVDAAPQRWFDYVADLPKARKGVLYSREYPLLNGAVVSIGRAFVGGELRNSAILAVPPTRNNLNGATFVEYTLTVPKLPKVELQFEAGVADLSGPSDGMLFGVQINGATQWRQTVSTGKWEAATLDLTAYAGTTITLRFLAHPRETLNVRNDIGCWANIALVTSFAFSQAPIRLNSPAGIAPKAYSPEITVDSADSQRVQAHVDLPAKFVVFNEEPVQPAVGESLLDFPYEVWRAYYGGLPEKGSVEGSGALEQATSLGATKPLTLVAIPPRNGYTIITTAIRVPEEATALDVEYGLTDPELNFGAALDYTGLEFSVQINGDVVFAESVKTAGWRGRLVDLTPYRGKPILIQLKTDSEKLSLFDWARWANLTIR